MDSLGLDFQWLAIWNLNRDLYQKISSGRLCKEFSGSPSKSTSGTWPPSTIAGVEEETLRKASELDSNHTVLTNQRDREDLKKSTSSTTSAKYWIKNDNKI